MDGNASDGDGLDGLTETQRKVLLADPTGNSKRVAKKLGLSPHTVDGHFRAIIRRMGVTDRLEAVARVHAKPPTQSLSAQPVAVAPPADSPMLNLSYEPPRSRRPMGLRDVAAERGDVWKAEVVSVSRGERGGTRSPLRIVLQIVLIAAGLVVLGSAALPLGHGFEALANFILSLRQR